MIPPTLAELQKLIKEAMAANPPMPFAFRNPWLGVVSDMGHDAITAAAVLIDAAEAADRGDTHQLIASLEALENTVYLARAAADAALIETSKEDTDDDHA